ncbi:response regulator transcription factor [Halarcobacter bivalviorum]|uniref:response regulator transcription factor n=1 Tax=Halarcobacter bivalviorum TaxID=663364 RepID=UPI00100A701D|nr:response regulator [Halarcobacter bivalviorum]RXK07111.1 DNA-binding response regulator [Halarcobacter bivalviorum]
MENIIKQLQNYTVLCVEDEDGIRKRLVNTLKYYFRGVYEAKNGEDGYYLYNEYKPDLIITDIEMPNKSGISLVEDIRKKDIDTLVIMVTAYSNEEYLLELINLNINQYILKPVNSDSLLNGIIKAFGKRLKEIIPFHKDLYFDMEQRELFYKEQLIPLRKRDKEFLLLLHRNRNVVVTYDLIEEYLWRDKSMSITALKTFIKEFRKRIPIEIITNKPQEGYKLINF